MAQIDLASRAQKYVSEIIADAFEVTADQKALVVFDHRSILSGLLEEAYRVALPEATFFDFDQTTPEAILEAMNGLPPKSFVALIQSSSFRLNEFRIRVELFKQGIKVIEHPHLGRMSTDSEVETYIESLAYDKNYYRTVGPALKEKIDRARRIVVTSGDVELVYEGDFEDAKLNIADYRGMKNWGGMFPIGEVFTEPKNLSNVNGRAKLCAFGDRNFLTNIPPEPIEIVIKDGIIVDAVNSTPEFDEVLREIREGEIATVRELGFGMNRAFTKEKTVSDIGTYERKCGIHLSIGGKHTIYAKEGFSKKHAHFHVDVFVDVTKVTIDDEVVFENGSYIV